MNLTEYRRMLEQTAHEGFVFTKYDPVPFLAGRPVVFLRHDVDLDLDLALQLAWLDRSLAVGSTFFIQSDCLFYDIYGYRSIQAVNELFKMGHDIALHVEFSPGDDLQRQVQDELQKMIVLFPFLRRDVFSIHRPGPLRNWDKVKFEIINVSSTHLFGRQIAYLSDSAGCGMKMVRPWRRLPSRRISPFN